MPAVWLRSAPGTHAGHREWVRGQDDTTGALDTGTRARVWIPPSPCVLSGVLGVSSAYVRECSGLCASPSARCACQPSRPHARRVIRRASDRSQDNEEAEAGERAAEGRRTRGAGWSAAHRQAGGQGKARVTHRYRPRAHLLACVSAVCVLCAGQCTCSRRHRCRSAAALCAPAPDSSRCCFTCSSRAPCLHVSRSHAVG